MGAGVFHGRVRDGIGCRLPAMATRSSNPPNPELPQDKVTVTGFGVMRALLRDPSLVLVGRPGEDRKIRTENGCAFDGALPSFLFLARRVGWAAVGQKSEDWMIAVQDGVV